MGEDKVASYDMLVAGEAGFVHRLVGRFAVFELTEPPAACRGVFSRVLDHQLNVNGGPATKDWSRPKTLLFSSDGT
jgi:hypothetical protein